MSVRTLKLFSALALCLASTPVFIGWQEVAHPADAARLQQLPQIREEAIADAQAGDGRGDWRCRQIKLGRMSS